MVRNWRRECPRSVRANQQSAMTTSALYLVRETGPTAFVIKQLDKREPFKVFLGESHSCTCREFLENRDLCLHICWVLLKKFKLKTADPLSYQTGLVARELGGCLGGDMTSQRSVALKREQKKANVHERKTRLQPRPANRHDHCPICLEEYSSDASPVMHCRYGCGNPAHLRCVQVLANHQARQSTDAVSCPLCRGLFATAEELKKESARQHQLRQLQQVPLPLPLHPLAECRLCLAGPPLRGNIYKCLNCPQVVICAACLMSENFIKLHSGHGVAIKKTAKDHWSPMACHQPNEERTPALRAKKILLSKIKPNISKLPRAEEKTEQRPPLNRCDLGLVVVALTRKPS